MKNIHKKNLDLLKKMVVFGIAMFLITSAIVAVQISSPMGSTEKLLVEWDVTMN